MKVTNDSQRASIERNIGRHGSRPAKVVPGASLFLRISLWKWSAFVAVVLLAAGAIGAMPLTVQGGKEATAGANSVHPRDRGASLVADDAFLRAAAKGDKTAAASLLGRQFTWTNRDGKTWNREQALANWKMLGATAGSESGVSTRFYGRVALVTGMGKVGNEDVRFGRIWIEGPGGWKAMVYQANPVLPDEAPAAPAAAGKGPGTCMNPCKEVPYEPKTAAVHSVVASWQALETANFSHDAEGWAEHVSDDFMLIRPNGKLLDKAFRMATIHHQKADSVVVHVPTAQWVHVRIFGDTAVMIAHHRLATGTPYRATRIWILRDGVWKLALSQQTIIK